MPAGAGDCLSPGFSAPDVSETRDALSHGLWLSNKRPFKCLGSLRKT